MDFPPRPESRPPRPARRRRPGSREETGELDWVPGFVSAPEDEPPQPGPEEEAGFPEPPRTRGEPPPPAGDGLFGGRMSSETVARVLWAIPWIVFAITVIALGGGVFAVAMIGIGWALLVEFFRMTQRARPFQLVALAALAGMVLAAHFGDAFQVLLVAVAFVPVMLGFALARPSLHNVTWGMAVTVFGVVWIGLPLAHAVLLRDIPNHGGALLVDVLVCTFFTDTFAYIGGRMFGQHQLAPQVSPNKTIEGLAIGIGGGVLGFWLAGLYQDWISGPEALLFGLCIALLAPMGDLFESLIKRDLDVKDTGRLLGPHGGLLDRLDAVLFTVVAGYYLSLAIVV
jgi:phosphatidate cytidylyltransferase